MLSTCQRTSPLSRRPDIAGKERLGTNPCLHEQLSAFPICVRRGLELERGYWTRTKSIGASS